MASTQQPPTPPTGQPAAAPTQGPAQTCPSCGSPLAPDQRYCLSCGARRGEPRVPLTPPPATEPTERVTVAEPPARPPSEVSPLAAVIGIALLGGMLLIGVLIGRGADDDQPPAPVVEVGTTPASDTPAPGAGGESEAVTEVTSEWPEGTEGFTIQLSTLPKAGATPESVDAAKQQAVEDGAIDAAVLDSDLFSSLPPGNYVIYSGVYTDRRSAEVALKGLNDNFPAAAVVEVADEGNQADEASGSEEPSAGDTSAEEEAAVPEPPITESDDAASGGASAGGQDKKREELR